MNLQIKPCDSFNRKQIENLSVSSSQLELIESNVSSLAEADQFQFWHPVGLYDNDLLVGFAMYGMCEDQTVWLDRFMIGEKFQHKGYGKKFLSLIINLIIQTYRCDKIFLSYLPLNAAIAEFYSSVGFKVTGERDDNDEIIMLLKME